MNTCNNCHILQNEIQRLRSEIQMIKFKMETDLLRPGQRILGSEVTSVSVEGMDETEWRGAIKKAKATRHEYTQEYMCTHRGDL